VPGNNHRLPPVTRDRLPGPRVARSHGPEQAVGPQVSRLSRFQRDPAPTSAAAAAAAW
jgi:hypothetical protein